MEKAENKEGLTSVRKAIGNLTNFLKRITLLVNGVFTYVLLSFVYLFGIGITSVFARLVGKRFLDMRRDATKESYWVEHEKGSRSLEDFKRQF